MSKIFLKLKTSVAYNLLKSELLKIDPDLQVIGGDGSVQNIHKDLLRCVSSKFFHALEYSKEKGHDIECLGAIKVPGLDESGLNCLYDLLYKGFHYIDSAKADDVIHRLNNLNLSLSDQNDPKDEWADNEDYASQCYKRSKKYNEIKEDISRRTRRNSSVRPLQAIVSSRDGESESGRRRSQNKTPKQEYDLRSIKAPSDSTDTSWCNRLRIRKRKMSASSADESATQEGPVSTPVKTPTTTSTTSSTSTSTSSSIQATPPPTLATISSSRRSSKKQDASSDDESEKPNAISQEDRDIQRITSVIKSFLPHPACFLVEDGNLECFVCGEIFRYRDNWRRHLLEQHFHLTFLCPTCGQKFKRRGKCSEHMLRCR